MDQVYNEKYHKGSRKIKGVRRNNWKTILPSPF